MTEHKDKFNLVEFRVNYHDVANLFEVGDQYKKAVSSAKRKFPQIPLFRSIALYAKDADDYAEKMKKLDRAKGKEKDYGGVRSLAGYRGEIWSDNVIIDIDHKDLSVSLKRVREVLERLGELNVDLNKLGIGFSGSKGFHVYIPQKMIGFGPSANYHKLVRLFMGRIFPETEVNERGETVPVYYDPKIYNSLMAIRLFGSFNEKSELYKTQLSYEKINSMTVDEIKEIAKTRGEPIKMDGDLVLNPELASIWPSEEDASKKALRFVTDRDIDPDFADGATVPLPIISTQQRMCEQFLLNGDAAEGQRNATALRLSSHFSSMGMPPDVVWALMESWYKKQSNPEARFSFEATVKSGIERRYFFPCDDDVLSKHCDKRCFMYETHVAKRKSLNIDLYKDLNALGKSYKEIMKGGRFIKLGIPEIDKVCRGFAPGENILLMGKTSVGKTTFMLFLAQQIYRATNQPILIIEQELADFLVFEKMIALATGTDPEIIESLWRISSEDNTPAFEELVESANENFKGIYVLPIGGLSSEEKIKHIEFFKEKIGKPVIVFEDYLGLTKDKGISEQERMGTSAKATVDIAKRCDVVYLALGQVNRAAGDDPSSPLHLSSSRDSGHIENSFANIFGMYRKNYGQKNDNTITIQILKTRRGPAGHSFDLKVDYSTGTYEHAPYYEPEIISR